jgi:hypothetical protein
MGLRLMECCTEYEHRFYEGWCNREDVKESLKKMEQLVEAIINRVDPLSHV